MSQKIYVLLLLMAFTLPSTAAIPDQRRAGTVHLDTIMDVPCSVYLPYHYDQRTQQEDIVFPVLYLHHGMWGNEHDWPNKGNLIALMDTLLQQDLIKEMVVIMPDNCPARPTTEEEKANATNGEWEGHFAQFMANAERRYRIGSQPALRAVAGLSMGGYHTMMVSSVLDGAFDYVGMFSAATFMHRAPSQPRVFWLGIGKEDFLFESFTQYRQWLNDNHIEYTYYESTGGHDWPNWQEYLRRFLPKLF